MSTSRPTATSFRHQYTSERLDTASNASVLGMCFERLDRDLSVALTAIEVADHFSTNLALGHAQDLVGEMAAMLDLDAWDHAPALLAVYDYVLRLLARANILKRASMVVEARTLLAEIGEAFATAAAQGAAGRPAPSGGGGWSVSA